MKLLPRGRELRGATVVLTGASSGIGRAAALEFARAGSRLVLAARREAPLRQLVSECQALGAEALAVPCDVSERSAVEALADRAVERFGRLDVWVNNASVAIVGSFEQTPVDAMRRLFDVNFWGYVYGTRAALERFRRQAGAAPGGDRGSGVVVNTVSLFGQVTGPYWSIYSASKFALRGLAKSLRQELRGTDIHVCSLFPASIDTPLWQHAANYTGRSIKAVDPVYEPEAVARAIVRLASHPRAELMVGMAGRAQALTNAVSARLWETLAPRFIEARLFTREPAPRTDGAVFEPVPQGTASSGGWRDGPAVKGLNARHQPAPVKAAATSAA